MSDHRAWVGIDPGARGAIAVVDSDGGWVVIDMPAQGCHGARAIAGLLDSAIAASPHIVVCVEHQRAYGGQGVVSSCALGQAYGWVRGVVDGWRRDCRAQVYYPAPGAWQPVILGRRSAGAPRAKDRALAVAAKEAPGVELQTKRGRVLDGRADAICIAMYARQEWRA